MKKTSGAKKRKNGAAKKTAKSSGKTKKVVKRVGAKKTPKVAKAPTHGKHIHPYGTERHPDFEWQMSRFQNTLNAFPESERKTVQLAFDFARDRHEQQYRIGGAPYMIHPLRIANILATEWHIAQPPVIAAALLHDVVEDTQTTIKEVKDRFGNEIGKLVDGMTMWKGSETHELYCKRVSRGPEELRMILCADTLDNLRSWYETGEDDRQARWWRNASEHVMPIARNTSEHASTAIAGVLNDTWYLKRAKML